MNSDSPNTADIVERLAERCELATGPDRELDATIYLTAFGDRPYGVVTGNKHQIVGVGTLSGYVETYRDVLTSDDALHDDVVPRYTASLDAALTLSPDGWTSINQEQQKLPDGSIRCWASIDAWPASPKRCATPALALCAAALRAHLAALKDHRKAQAHDSH